jgi:hypothetical protein
MTDTEELRKYRSGVWPTGKSGQYALEKLTFDHEALAAENESLRARIAQPSSDEVREAVEGLQRLLDTCTTLNGKPVRPGSAYRQDLDTLVRAAIADMGWSR